MTQISRSALLPYSCQQVYALINDVSAYPHYMNGCVGVEVYQHGVDELGQEFMEARLDLSKGGFRHSLTTRNKLFPPTKVEMKLVDGPVENFTGLWELLPLSEDACKVSLSLGFSISSRMLGAAARVMFEPLADDLVDSLVKRAHNLHQP